MDKIYEVKQNLTSDDFVKIGYEILPFELTGNDLVVAKIVTFPKEHPLAQQAINRVLNNKKWQEEVLFKQDLRSFLEEIDILFEEYTDEKGNKNLYVIENEELFELVCNWRIEVNLSDEDRWLGLTASDIFIENVYYNIKILDQFCIEEVEKLLELGYISIKEV